MESKVDKLNIHQLVPVPDDLTKPNDVVKNDVVKKMCIMLRSNILKIKYRILLT